MDNETVIRINGMLNNTPAVRLEAFVQGLREQMGSLAARQRRAETLALLVAAAFLFIEIAAIGQQVTVGPFEITNLREIEPFLPILYSYFIYEEVVSTSQYVFTRGIWDASVKVYDRRLYDTGLDRLLVPPLSSLAGPWFIPGMSTRFTSLIKGVNHAIMVGAYSGALLLFGVAFWRLFLHFGVSDPFVWVSLVASSALLAFAGIVTADRTLNYRRVAFLAATDLRGNSEVAQRATA